MLEWEKDFGILCLIGLNQDTQDLVYTIIDQTKLDLVECSINNEKHIDCEVKQNKEGISTVTVQVDDLEFRDRAIFNVEVSQFCEKRNRKGCIGDVVYWFDSCGNKEELNKVCQSGEICKDGECESQCIQNAEKKCDGDLIYWFDSCGKKGMLYYNCRDNPARKQCRNAQCCVGNFFCTAPSLSCKDECAPGSKQCSGSGYQVCNEFNNDGCLEWGQAIDCGSDSCDDFGSWTCKDSTTKKRERACYKKGCSAGNCYSNPWIDSQDEACPSGQKCEGGSCIAACTPQTCSSLGKQCGNWADNCGGTLNCGGCSSGQKCDNGKCVNAVASLSASYSNLQKNSNGAPPGFGGGNWWYFSVTLKETSGTSGIMVQKRQRCYVGSSSNFCATEKTDIATWYGTDKIPPGGQITGQNQYTWTDESPWTVTETFWGVDDFGNNVQASYSFTVS